MNMRPIPHLRVLHGAVMTQKDNLPAALADVALIDGKTCAAAGSMSESWWHAEVAAGRAPQPVIRAPRCTRWSCADVANFWRRFPERDAGAKVPHAAKASAAAKAKRAHQVAGAAA